jgi:hypothetical protein
MNALLDWIYVNEFFWLDFQVKIDNQWGTVCNFGWTIESAALACQQMGWVLNTEDWEIPPNQIPKAGSNDPVLMSNVR